MNIQKKLTSEINKLVKELFDIEKEVLIETPQDPSHGDYSSNIAMTLTRDLKQNPKEIATQIVSKLQETQQEFSEIEIAGPGFINFKVSEKYLIHNLKEILKDIDENLRSSQFEGENIIVEYTDPNPFKVFHIGHLYSNTVGESIARIFEINGAKVHRANFYGDVGMHVAKAIWGIMRLLREQTSSLNDIEKLKLKERIDFMGKAYALGATAFKEGEESQKEEIKQLNSIVYEVAQQIWIEEGVDPVVEYKKFMRVGDFDIEEVKTIYKTGRKWSLEYFEEIYERLGTKFDGYYPESRAGEIGYQLVQEGLQKNVFKESDGAIVFPGENFGLHTRVFINSLGLPTYESKDFGLASWKDEKFPYDKSIIVTGNEIDAYFKVVIQAMKELQPEFGAKTFHISHGMVRLPEGKMSSRTGKILSGEWLINEAKSKAVEKIHSAEKKTLELNEVDDVAEKVAIAGVKYSLLKSSIGKDISFDFDSSISFEGNSGPYIQYTYSRCKSILNSIDIDIDQSISSLNEEEKSILRTILKYNENIEIAAREFAPNIIANYVYDLAQKFNSFYNKHRILDDEEYQDQRILIVQATANVLQKCLYILGIKTNEKM